MNTIYTASKTIQADIQEVNTLFAQATMAADYFPEIHKDASDISAYIRTTHKHPNQVFPDYQIPYQGLGWTTGGGTSIRLPRKDINANIQSIDVEFKTVGEKTRIAIRVEFEPYTVTEAIVTARHVRMMIANKLNAIKNNLEANKHQGWAPAFA